ncbi:MAG: thioredoxin family protein [Eggerthellaceae bacterium]|nr:thioredoxin family protein [Eggerthellaceae bacterium]
MEEDVFASNTIEEIRDEATWARKVDEAPGRVMVEFFVTWCPHCQREAPILDETAARIREGGVEVYHANAEVMYMKGAVYGLEETPSFILVEDGKLIAKHEGFLTADELVQFSEGNINDLTPSVNQSLSSVAF